MTSGLKESAGLQKHGKFFGSRVLEDLPDAKDRIFECVLFKMENCGSSGSTTRGKGARWELREESIVSTCRPWWRLYARDTGSGRRTGGPTCSQDCTDDNTAFMLQAWSVKTAFDVAKPSVVSRILTLTGAHGHPTAALLAEMQDVRGSACFENRRD